MMVLTVDLLSLILINTHCTYGSSVRRSKSHSGSSFKISPRCPTEASSTASLPLLHALSYVNLVLAELTNKSSFIEQLSRQPHRTSLKILPPAGEGSRRAEQQDNNRIIFKPP